MFEFITPRPLPAPGIDPILSPYPALRIMLAGMSLSPRPETIVLTLDRERCGRMLLVVPGTSDPDELLGVVDSVAELARRDPDAGGVVIGTVRPAGGVVDGDRERWADADDLCTDADLELVEWFVLGELISCPRAQLGLPSRWPS